MVPHRHGGELGHCEGMRCGTTAAKGRRIGDVRIVIMRVGPPIVTGRNIEEELRQGSDGEQKRAAALRKRTWSRLQRKLRGKP